MTARKRWSATQRARFFHDNHETCHLCGGRINAEVEGWDLSHEIPLELGGADDATNIRVAHRKCHRKHTAEVDVPTLAEAKRRELRNLGIKATPSRKIQSAGFQKAQPQRRASKPLDKPRLPPRQLYVER